MNAFLTWLPQLCVAFAGLGSAILAYARAHKRQQEHARLTQNTVTPATPLNGYASILRDALARIEWLRDENEALHRRNDELEQRLSESQDRELGLQPRPRRRRTAPTTSTEPAPHPRRKRTPPSN